MKTVLSVCLKMKIHEALFLLVIFVCTCYCEEERTPRIFYIKTTKVSTTLLSANTCWATSTGAITTACKRRKRMVDLETFGSVLSIMILLYNFISILGDDDIEPSRVDSSLGDVDADPLEKDERNPKQFEFYWLTTTKYVRCDLRKFLYFLISGVLHPSLTPQHTPSRV